MNIRFSDKIQEFVTFLTALCSNLQKSIANEEIYNMHTLPQVQAYFIAKDLPNWFYSLFFFFVAKHKKTW